MCKVVHGELDLMSQKMCKVALFIYILILFKNEKKKSDMVDDVAQLKRSNNK